MHKKVRDQNRVQTSYLTYDLTILGIENISKKTESTSKIFNEIKADLKSIISPMETHCNGYRQLYDNLNNPFCIQCKTSSNCANKCIICTDLKEHSIEQEYEIAKSNKDFHILEMIEKRKSLVHNAWNSIIKPRNCSINLYFNNSSSPFFFLFGTLAIGAILPVSSPFWSSRIRLRLASHSYIASIDNFPMHRVKRSYTYSVINNRNVFSNEDISVHPSPNTKTFISYTFIQKFPNTKTKSGGRAKYLLNLTNYLLGNSDKDNRDDKIDTLSNKLEKVGVNIDTINLSFFLTYSTSYPFVIKSEFKDMKDLSSFINILDDDPAIGSFNTIIGYQDSELFCNNSIESENSSETLFQLLIRAINGSMGLAHDITESLNSSFKELNKKFNLVSINIKNHKNEDIHSSWYERPYYWDICIFFKTDAISTLVNFMLTDINQIRGIMKTALMPIYNSVDEESIAQQKIDPNGPSNQPIDEMELIKNYEDEWTKGLDGFPDYDYTIDDTIERISDDQYLIRWNHLRQEVRWLISYTGQLEKEWIRQANFTNTDEEDKGISTFVGISRTLSFILDKVLDFDKTIIEFQEIQNKAKDTKKFSQLIIWKFLKDLSQQINSIKNYLISIRFEFNTKIEALQMINLTGPLKSAGDPAGVTDLTIEAARRLFKHYCSKPSKYSILWGEKNRTHDYREWNGIVTTTTAKDFQLILPLQLLYLPIDMKFKTQGKFLILAHEAAHQILYWIERTRYKDRNKSSPENAWISFENEVWSELALLTDTWVEKKKKEGRYNDKIASISGIIGKNRKLTKNFYSQEFLCDIVALLCAGPAYIRPLFGIVYLPREVDSVIVKDNTIHPPMWLRITILLYVCHLLRWIKLFGENEDETIEYNSRYDSFGIYNLAKHHFSKYEMWGSGSLWDIIKDTDKLIDNLNSFEWRYETAVLGALSLDNKSKFLKKLIVWGQKHSENFLYYPLRNIDVNSSPGDIDNAWKEYNSDILIVNQYVKFLSERMIYNNEIILDAPLKYISAAMCLPDVIHPLYSTGKIMHSLCYAHDVDYSIIFNCANW